MGHLHMARAHFTEPVVRAVHHVVGDLSEIAATVQQTLLQAQGPDHDRDGYVEQSAVESWIQEVLTCTA